MAISSPLLEDVSITGAEAVLVNICGGENLGIHTVNEAMNIVNDSVGGDANVIFGAVIDPEMGDGVRITVIATGFGLATLEEMEAMDAEAKPRLGRDRLARRPAPGRALPRPAGAARARPSRHSGGATQPRPTCAGSSRPAGRTCPRPWSTPTC